MAYDGNLQLLLTSEELMIVHLSRHESVGPQLKGWRHEECSCSATDGHAPDWATQQLVCLHTFHVKRALKHNDEIVGSQRFFKLANHSRATLYAVNHLCGKQTCVFQPHLLGNLEVHSAHSVVHIGVHRHDDYAVLYGFHHHALHVVAV